VADYCVKTKSGQVAIIYNGDAVTSEFKRQQAEAAAKSGNYGPGCTVAEYVPPAPAPEEAAEEEQP
jgi:hypothetical protein